MSRAAAGELGEIAGQVPGLSGAIRLLYRAQIALRRVPALYALVAFLFPLALVAAVWAFLASLRLYPDYLFPSPSQVLVKGWEMALTGEIFRHIAASMYRLG